jgi:hypothetical protein
MQKLSFGTNTTVELCVNQRIAGPWRSLFAKREEVTQAQQKLVALQCTPHSEERDKAIADLKLQIAILKEEEAECHQLFKNSLKP